MTARAYYNEIDPAAAHVLRELISAGVIAPGEVDTRSIKDVLADDLLGFTQCHFFAGGGLWSVAARLAGWPDERPLWTGSCPCQPFSVAGKGAGTDDVRHLWPDFFRLIRERRPAVVVGEQVAGSAGYGWLDGVRADLAGEGYASRGVDIPALAVDAPHIRQRLYWLAVADADRGGCAGRTEDAQRRAVGRNVAERVAGVPFGDAERARLEGQRGDVFGTAQGWGVEDRSFAAPDDRQRAGALVHSASERRGEGWPEYEFRGGRPTASSADLRPNGSAWSDAEWITCHDGKARRTKPGLRFLVDGLPGRVDLWRIGGNAISPILAAEVLAAFLDTERC